MHILIYSTDDGNEGAVYRMSLLDVEGTEYSFDQKISSICFKHNYTL